MVIYLKHPDHGSKVAISEVEATEDQKNGWVLYDPETPPPALPSFLAPAVEAPKSKGGRPKKS